MDSNEIIKDFPLLQKRKIAYLDSGATTQKPVQVIETVNDFYENNNANPHRGAYSLSIEATEEYENTRTKIANFINAKHREEIIFSKNATESLNLIAYSYGLDNLKKDDESNVFVLKKNGEVIGYESMFVEYDILHIGHIAVKSSERGNGYGKLLTKLAILVAENEDRDVALYCDHPNSYLEKLGFKTKDRIHYLYKRKGIKSKGLKRLFVKPEEYSKRKDEEMKKEVDRFKKFLDSDIVKAILREEEEK